MIITIIWIVGLMVGWVIIQSFWKKTFIHYMKDDDVMADRISCSNCGCTTACKNNEHNTLS